MPFSELVERIKANNRGSLDYLPVDQRNIVIVGIFQALVTSEVTIGEIPTILFGPEGSSQASASIQGYLNDLISRQSESGEEALSFEAILRGVSAFIFHSHYEGASLRKIFSLVSTELVVKAATLDANDYLDHYLRTGKTNENLRDNLFDVIRLIIMARHDKYELRGYQAILAKLPGGDQIQESDFLTHLIALKKPSGYIPFEIYARLDNENIRTLKNYFESPYSADNYSRNQLSEMMRWYKSRGFTRQELERIIRDSFTNDDQLKDYKLTSFLDAYEWFDNSPQQFLR